MWFRSAFGALYVLHLQHVVQHHFDALYKGDAFRMRVEDADVLGVEQSNGPGGLALVAGAGHLVEADGSDTLTGGFVKYAVLITRPSRAHPLK